MPLPSHLTLLGHSPVFAPLCAWASKAGVATTVLTAPDQAEDLRRIGGVDFTVLDKLDLSVRERIPEAFAPDAVAISFGARWIIRKAELEGLFHGRLFNIHGTRLPMDRGGGGFSWRIMRGDRIGCLLLHLIDDGIDTGPIVAIEDYVIPSGLRTPAEIQGDYEPRMADFVIAFLERGAPADPLFRQTSVSGAYYPRLHTPTHGWIDWSWPAEEIERFILAFDDPFPGARTCWRDENVIVRKAQLHFGETPHHPFQTGLVLRNNGRWLVVALRQGASLIVEETRNESGESLLASIREGDRLFTPAAQLEIAQQQRVVIGPQGMKISR
jgi:methionyl-tRNA formyltransferase